MQWRLQGTWRSGCRCPLRRCGACVCVCVCACQPAHRQRVETDMHVQHSQSGRVLYSHKQHNTTTQHRGGMVLKQPPLMPAPHLPSHLPLQPQRRNKPHPPLGKHAGVRGRVRGQQQVEPLQETLPCLASGAWSMPVVRIGVLAATCCACVVASMLRMPACMQRVGSVAAAAAVVMPRYTRYMPGRYLRQHHQSATLLHQHHQ